MGSIPALCHMYQEVSAAGKQVILSSLFVVFRWTGGKDRNQEVFKMSQLRGYILRRAQSTEARYIGPEFPMSLFSRVDPVTVKATTYGSHQIHTHQTIQWPVTPSERTGQGHYHPGRDQSFQEGSVSSQDKGDRSEQLSIDLQFREQSHQLLTGEQSDLCWCLGVRHTRTRLLVRNIGHVAI